VITAIVSLPQPPLLLAGMTGGPVADVEELRDACRRALWSALATGPDGILIVGGLRAVEVGEPLSIRVGWELVADACTAGPGQPRTVPVRCEAVPSSIEADAATALGRELASGPQRICAVVMADGSARRGPKAPGYLDERAAPFDARVERALASGAAASLAELEAELAAELLVAGRAAWNVMAGLAGGRAWQAELRYSGDPFGVWYPVAVWT